MILSANLIPLNSMIILIAMKSFLGAMNNGKSNHSSTRRDNQTIQKGIASRIQEIVQQHLLNEDIEFALPERKSKAISQRNLDLSDEAYG
jgi:hypothetical protein